MVITASATTTVTPIHAGDSERRNKNLTSGTLAGAVIGVAGILVLVIVACVMIKRMKKKKRETSTLNFKMQIWHKTSPARRDLTEEAII
jgi:ABC-type lipoprotein release transport system permease subunit